VKEFPGSTFTPVPSAVLRSAKLTRADATPFVTIKGVDQHPERRLSFNYELKRHPQRTGEGELSRGQRLTNALFKPVLGGGFATRKADVWIAHQCRDRAALPASTWVMQVGAGSRQASQERQQRSHFTVYTGDNN